jgi:DNA polymerase-3 subunit epsilon
MITLIIDMETTGLEPKYNDVWNISWLILEREKAVKFRDRYYPIRAFGADYWKFSMDYVEKDGLIYPRRYRVSRNHYWTEDKELIEDVINADIIVGHNIGFELGFLKLIIPDVWRKAQYCTMNMTTDICKLPYNEHKYKWPKLQEAYSLLIEGQGLSGLERFIPGNWHDARYDVFAALRIYEYMTQTKFDIPWYIWLQAGVGKGYLGELKGKMKSKIWELKNIFKKEEEELPF